MSRNNEKVENKKLFKSTELEIEENFKSEVDKRYNIYNHLKNNASEIVSKASNKFLAEKPKLIAKGGIIYRPRDMIVFLRDMDWLLKIVVYSIFQKVQPTQLSVFKSVIEKVVKDSAIKKLSKQDTTFAIKTLEETARSSLNEEPVVDSDFTELLEKHFESLKNFFLNFSFDEESLDAGEKNTADSPDQNLEEKVMNKDLMRLSDYDKDFMNKAFDIIEDDFRSRSFISVQQIDEFSYQVNKRFNRGDLKTLDEKKEFIGKLERELGVVSDPEGGLNKEEILRFQELVKRIVNF